MWHEPVPGQSGDKHKPHVVLPLCREGPGLVRRHAKADNPPMDLRRAIVLALSLCILFAPLAGNAAMPASPPIHHHAAAAPEMHDCDGMDGMSSQRQDSIPVSPDDEGRLRSCALSHACCLGLDAALPAQLAMHHAHIAIKPVALVRQLYLPAEASGIFKPPRLNS